MWCLVAVISLLLFIFNYGRWSRLLNRLGKEFKTLRVYTLLFYTVATKYKRSVCENFDQLVATHPQKVLFYFQDEIWTSSKVKEESNKVSLYFESRGYRRGDVVAIMLDNCPEYICLWLGLAQIGVVPALINTNIVKDALVHSLSVAKCSAVIYGSNYGPTINDIAKQFTNLEKYQLPCKTADEGLSGEIDLRTELRNIDPYTFIQKLKFRRNDVLMFIFTSGTTGLPKAALLSHAKYSLLSSTAILLPPNSVIYCPMPLYHASGSVLGVGQALIWGNTVVLRKKFSASNFWSDCIQYRCNVAQYIGEMCRYVLSASDDKKINHPVKIMYGNGLKPHVWRQFNSKFGIERVLEFYGATDCNGSFVNLTNTVGSVGYLPLLLKFLCPMVPVKFDRETGEPLRDKNGRCIKCRTREPGVLIVKITNKFGLLDYEGYTNKEDTNKKIVKNAFKIGDRYCNTGDVFEIDEDGDYYFIDRIGDTFRWKGENVSTCEVEDVINNLIHLNDATVFGVQIPSAEGRAGMAAIVSDDLELDTDHLLKGLKENLPSYAIPLFIRVMKSIPVTSTFKLMKVQLRTEGYNVNFVKDKIYFYDQRCDKYVLLSLDLYDEIMRKTLKL